MTHLDKGIESWFPAIMIKTENEFFVIKRDYTPVNIDSTKTNCKPLLKTSGYYSYNDIDYPMDSYYRLDSVNRKLERVKPLSKKEVLKEISKKFNFKEHIKVLASTNKYTYIAKDTLKDSQIYYQINTQYDVKKQGNGNFFRVTPIFSVRKENINKLGIFKNGKTELTDFIGCSYPPIDKDKFCLYAKYNYAFSEKMNNNEYLELEHI